MIWAWTVQQKSDGRIIARGISPDDGAAREAADKAARPDTVCMVLASCMAPPRDYAPERPEGPRQWRKVLDAKGQGEWVAAKG